MDAAKDHSKSVRDLMDMSERMLVTWSFEGDRMREAFHDLTEKTPIANHGGEIGCGAADSRESSVRAMRGTGAQCRQRRAGASPHKTVRPAQIAPMRFTISRVIASAVIPFRSSVG
jgi:hypothetical protein